MSWINKFGHLKISNFKSLLDNGCNKCGNVSYIFNSTKQALGTNISSRELHVSLPRSASHFKPRDRKELLKSVPKWDEGTEGEHTVSMDAIIQK